MTMLTSDKVPPSSSSRENGSVITSWTSFPSSRASLHAITCFITAFSSISLPSYLESHCMKVLQCIRNMASMTICGPSLHACRTSLTEESRLLNCRTCQILSADPRCLAYGTSFPEQPGSSLQGVSFPCVEPCLQSLYVVDTGYIWPSHR